MGRSLNIDVEAVENGQDGYPKELSPLSRALASMLPGDRLEVSADQIFKALAVLKGPNGNQAHELALRKLADAAHSAAGAKVLADAGGVRSILGAMKGGSLTEGALLASCNTLLGLCLEPRVCQEVVTKGGVEVTVQFLRTHITSETVAAAACKVLQKLALTSKPRAVICSQGGLALIERVMRRHQGSADVQENGCFVLCNLALDSNTTAEDHHSNVKIVINAMQWHPDNLAMLGAAVCTLYNLMCKGDYGELAVTWGGHVALKRAMGQHVSLARMREAQALLAAWDESSASPKIKLGQDGKPGSPAAKPPRRGWMLRGIRDGVTKAIGTLQNPRSGAKEFASACSELSKSSATVPGKKKITENGGVNALVKAMRRSDANTDMLCAACTTLWDFCHSEDDGAAANYSREVANRGGCEALLQLLSGAHCSCVDVADAACKVIQQLALAGEARSRICRQGGLATIEQIMSQHFNCAGVQESGCSAICNLALEPGMQLFRKNVGTIVATMKGHRSNVEVQEAAVCAMYNLICTGNLLEAVIDMGGGQVVATAMSNHARVATMPEARAIAEAASEDGLGLGMPLWGPTPSTYSVRNER